MKNEVVKINNQELPVIEWKGQRVITTAQLADVYEATEIQIKQNFNNNAERFEEEKHYFLLKGEELKSFKNMVENFDLVGKNANQLSLWTRRGASRHSKMLGTDKAWEQYDALEENYYNPRENVIDKILENPDFGIQLLTSYKVEKEKNKILLEENKRMKPKEIFADAVAVADTSILIGELAKLMRQNGIDIGQNRLFAWMRENGFLISRKGTDYNMPTQKSADMELIEIKERTICNPDGTNRITKTPKVTGKGQQYFINKFLNNRAIEEVC